MSAISGLPATHLAALPPVKLDLSAGQAQDTGRHRLDLSPGLGDLRSLSPGELYGVLAGEVAKHGSQEARDALAAGQAFELDLFLDGEFLGTAHLDPTPQTANFSSNTNTANSNGGTSDPTLLLGMAPDPRGDDRAIELPPLPQFILDLFDRRD